MFCEENPEVGVAISRDLDAILELDELVLGSSARRGTLVEAVGAGYCYFAKINGRSAGFAVVERSFYGHAFVSLVVVHPGYRRRGVATALIRCVESNCPTEKLFTSTNCSNTIMQRALEKLGFTESGRIYNLDEGDPEIVYFKNTGPL